MRVEIDGRGTEYGVAGSGRPLILLHGNGEDRRIFDAGVPMLSERFTVYSVDSRGHGGSDPAESYHYEDMAEDMHAFASELGLKDPVVFGFSDGGIVGLIWAIRYPGDIGYLISAGANTRPEALKGLSMLLVRLRNRIRPDPIVTMMLEEPHITAEMLSEISVPSLIVRAEHDCIDEDDTDLIAGSIPSAEKLVVPGADHCSYVVGSTEFAEIILEAAESHFRRPPASVYITNSASFIRDATWQRPGTFTKGNSKRSYRGTTKH